ncbi:MAG: DNA repair protein RadC [Parasporobacterium sp.]|nr:DNA repair protein RadC [Parasporobacterium sp.]
MEKITTNRLPWDLRPDERFIKLGPAALTDAELLAIILRCGSKELSSVDLARNILYSEPGGRENIITIFDYEIEDLKKIKGIGQVKALQIKAVGELSSRIARSNARKALKFNDPKSIADYYMEQLRHLKKEVVVLLMLNSSGELIKELVMSSGTVNSSLIPVREIFIDSLRYEAVNIIILHNHPGGSVTPSDSDISSTERLVQAGKIISIPLLDHIIIGDMQYFSFREEGLLK